MRPRAERPTALEPAQRSTQVYRVLRRPWRPRASHSDGARANETLEQFFCLCTGVFLPVHTGKRNRGEPGHTGKKRDSQAHGTQTNLTTIQPTNAHARPRRAAPRPHRPPPPPAPPAPRDDRIRGRLYIDYTATTPEPTEPRGRLYSQAAPSEPDPAASRSQSASDPAPAQQR